MDGLEEVGLWDGMPGGLQTLLQGHLLDALTFHFVEIAIKQKTEARDALFFQQFMALRGAANEARQEQDRLWAEVKNSVANLEGYQRWQLDILVFVRDSAGRTEGKIDAVSDQIETMFAFLREHLDKASIKQSVAISEHEQNQVARRANRLKAILHGAKVLWVDDVPDNNFYEREILNQLGTQVDSVTTTQEALDCLMASGLQYDVIVSDLGRPHDNWTEDDSAPDNRLAGLRFLDAVVKRRYPMPVIFYMFPYLKEKGVPPRAFGATDRPDELMHLVMDALERKRG